MTDSQSRYSAGLDHLAYKLVAVTPNDDADLPDGPCRALLVGAGGAATLVDDSGALCTAVPLQTGYNPIRTRRIHATDLVASNVWALY